MNDKKQISDRERERRARQAEQQAAGSGAGGSKFAGNAQRGGLNPSSLAQRPQKKTGRGPKGGE